MICCIEQISYTVHTSLCLRLDVLNHSLLDKPMSFIFLEESGQFYYSYIKGITCIVLRYVTIFKEFKVQCIMLHRYINLQQISFYVIGVFFAVNIVMMIQKKMQLDNELLSPIYKLMSVSNSIVQRLPR